MKNRWPVRTHRFIHALVAATILALDVWTKELAEVALPAAGGSRGLIDGFLSLTLVHNTGAAFGLFASSDPRSTTRILNLVAVVALGIVAYYSFRAPAGRFRLQAGLSLIFGGALGNLLDRALRGYVVDFVEVYYRTFHWPNFNVADSAITVGVTLLMIDSFFGTFDESRENDPAPSAHS